MVGEKEEGWSPTYLKTERKDIRSFIFILRVQRDSWHVLNQEASNEVGALDRAPQGRAKTTGAPVDVGCGQPCEEATAVPREQMIFGLRDAEGRQKWNDLRDI